MLKYLHLSQTVAAAARSFASGSAVCSVAAVPALLPQASDVLMDQSSEVFPLLNTLLPHTPMYKVGAHGMRHPSACLRQYCCKHHLDHARQTQQPGKFSTSRKEHEHKHEDPKKRETRSQLACTTPPAGVKLHTSPWCPCGLLSCGEPITALLYKSTQYCTRAQIRCRQTRCATAHWRPLSCPQPPVPPFPCGTHTSGRLSAARGGTLGSCCPAEKQEQDEQQSTGREQAAKVQFKRAEACLPQSNKQTIMYDTNRQGCSAHVLL